MRQQLREQSLIVDALHWHSKYQIKVTAITRIIGSEGLTLMSNQSEIFLGRSDNKAGKIMY